MRQERHPALAVDIEARIVAQYRDKPLPKLSDELRKKLGIGIPKLET